MATKAAIAYVCGRMGKRVLVPLPDRDFDVTEVAVPWRLLSRAGHEVVFATERGREGGTPACDPLLLTGVIFGKLGAEPEPKTFYAELERDPAFRAPIAWGDAAPTDFDALLLPGGHAPGMRQYLGSEALQRWIVDFARLERPLAAICHGVLAAARARDPQTGRSVLHGRKTTCLPKWMERSAYWMTAWKLGRYYRTYDAYVEDEVVAALASKDDFARGPLDLARGTMTDDRPTFLVEDGAYVSARWPGDAYAFARALLARL
jgi:putative intracellular protease/amidase